MIPGWPYSFIAALETGRTSWTVLLDAGYEAPRIAWLLRDLPVEIRGRMRSDRVLRRATLPRVYQALGGRPARHGGEFVFGDPATWDVEHAVTRTNTRLYGQARAQAWDGCTRGCPAAPPG
ncbi:hypothetical protein Ahu01nite_061320 [Winogradskya humida]|uniref:Transposase IS701-like DDE domain-containing protein n=1 Tax=Winogradskya humida TaxID=113566 RepID=A0ABQ3ZWR1_9ACTN|nr:hypothetical protein Ahu01nite_061320 [Actinoplanes humidus]